MTTSPTASSTPGPAARRRASMAAHPAAASARRRRLASMAAHPATPAPVAARILAALGR